MFPWLMSACCFYIPFLNVSLFVIFCFFFQNSIDNSIPLTPPELNYFPKYNFQKLSNSTELDFRIQVKKKSSSGGSTASEICIWKNSQDQGVRENQIISTVLVWKNDIMLFAVLFCEHRCRTSSLNALDATSVAGMQVRLRRIWKRIKNLTKIWVDAEVASRARKVRNQAKNQNGDWK